MPTGYIKVWRVAFLSIFSLSFSLSSGWDQQYPTKPINMIVGWGAGGAAPPWGWLS